MTLAISYRASSHEWFQKSEGLLSVPELSSRLAARFFGHPTSSGAVSILYAGTSDKVTKADTGSYYAPWCKKGLPIKATLDVKQQDQLYDVMETWRTKILSD